MHRILKAFICVAVAAMLSLSLSSVAFADSEAVQGIEFAVYCRSVTDINTATQSGADYVSVADGVSLTQAVKALENTAAALIVDADSIEEADEKFSKISALNTTKEVYYRIKDGAGKCVDWAKSNGALLMGYYKGNIYPIAVSKISNYAQPSCSAILLQTNNQDGVILHNSVTSFFEKHGIKGMFSFADSTKSAKRTDSARSWDDLIARGYTVIETAYPADFAIYLKNNTDERTKLTQSVSAAKTTSTEGCAPNRVKDYTSALEAAEILLSDSTSATYAMADARAVLDEAVRNISVPDGSKIQGDVEFTAGRVVAALFGIALVLSWQLFFRSRWAKKSK